MGRTTSLVVFAKSFQILENKVPRKRHGCELLAMWEAWPLWRKSYVGRPHRGGAGPAGDREGWPAIRKVWSS